MVAKVSNPLTVIAMFAAIAEGFAAVALIQLPTEIQQTFVWFVMAFPILLVVAFFWTLNKNSKVLYAPSDFTSDESYLAAHGIVEARERLKREIAKGAQLPADQMPAFFGSLTTKVEALLQDVLLTDREKDIVQVLRGHRMRAPDVASALGISIKAATIHLINMESKGVVKSTNEDGGLRFWTVVDRKDDKVSPPEG